MPSSENRLSHRAGRRAAAIALVGSAILSGWALSPRAESRPVPRPLATADPDQGFLRGMTVSCPGYGRIWGSGEMADSLRQLSELGVRWVAIHPYARVRRDGSVRFQPAAATGYLGGTVAIAGEAGIALLWKPHLAYWGSFEWRGEIGFGSDERAWRRFFDGYTGFIVD